MKKSKIFKIGLFSLLIVTMMLIISCEKIEDPDPIVTTPTTYTVEAFVIGFGRGGGEISPVGMFFEVDSGSSMEFTLTPNPGFKTDSIFVNNKLELLTDNTFRLENIADNYRLDAVFKLTKEFEPLLSGIWTTTGTIMTGKYRGTGEDFYDEFDLEGRDSIFIHNYRFNAELSEVYEYDNPQGLGLPVGNYTFKLTPGYLLIGNRPLEILELSNKKMVLRESIPVDSTHFLVGYLTNLFTFEHK